MARVSPSPVPPVSILPGPDSVLHMTEVTVRRSPTVLLDAVHWNVEVDQRWVILGPNGAGKTTLLQVAAGLMFPTSGRVHILGERLGAVDVSELRPRIGLSSAALAGRVPPQERVLDVVVSAGYGVVGRWRERYDEMDFDRGRELLDAMGVAALADRTYGTLSEGERKRTLAARALTRLAVDPYAPTTVLVTHHVEEIPPAFSHVLLLRGGAVVAAGPLADTLTAEALSETFDMKLILETRGERYFAFAAG
jgi:iron complex transport system ATP-binding protein